MAEMSNNDLDLGFLYKTMIERDPKKRRVKPVESLIGAIDLEDSEDDSDYMPNTMVEDEDDVDVDSSDDNDKNADNEEEDDSEDESKSLKGSLKSKNRKSSIKPSDSLSSIGFRSPPRQSYSTASILVCSVCLGDISRSDDEVVECDSCGISVHEGCYGIVSDDTESLHSNTSSASTEPWFCDPCRANVRNPYCELCPNSGGIFKETDAGRWVHMVCALYIPGVAFSDVTKLTGLTLFEMPYSRWGHRACILCEDERLSRTGVCICCDAGMCKSYFHVTCAQREGLLSESHSVDDVDPFIAYCKLHADKSTQRSKRRNWLALQSRFRSDFNTITSQRIHAKLHKQRNKWKDNRNDTQENLWVPTQKMPRLLNTSSSAIKRLIRKAELLGLSPQTHIVSHDMGDVRRKWHVPPAFSVEFISYFIDRNNRMSSMQKRSEELIAQNSQLKETEKTTRLAYEKSLHEFERIKDCETDCFRFKVEKYFNILNELSEQKIPLPKILEVTETTKKSLSTSDSKRKHSSVIRMNECGICHQTKDQHQLALCDSCQLYYHLYCLDPPLTRMPKKTRFGGWQCSDCTEQQETQDSDNEASNHSVVDAPRKLREHVKGPNKFEPDAGYSPPSSVSSASKLLKRKSSSNPNKKKKRKIKEKTTEENSETSETIRQSIRTSPTSHRKQYNCEENCFQCNQTATLRERVQCDNCDNFYHLSCLDPPVKKSPKQRGYTWFCHHCDLSDEEEEDDDDNEEQDMDQSQHIDDEEVESEIESD